MNLYRILIIVPCVVVLSACAELSLKPDAKPAAVPVKQNTVPEKAAVEVPHQEDQVTMPLNKELVYGLLVGEIAAKRGEFKLAYDEYYKVALASQDGKAAERATQLAQAMKDPKAIRESVSLWGALEPDSIPANRLAALAYAASGQKEKAVTHLKEMVRLLEEKGQDGYLQAGLIITKIKDKSLALEIVEALVVGQEKNAKAWYAYSVVAVSAERYPLAETNVNQAISLKDDWTRAHILLSRILLAQDKGEAAGRGLKQALQKYPNDDVLRIAYARYLIDIKDYETAREEFLTLLDKTPDNADVLFTSGILALQLDQLDEARTHFEHLVKLRKRLNEATFYLGQVEEAAENKVKAVHWYKKVKGRHLLDSRIRLAQLYADSGNLKGARELLQQLRGHAGQESVRLFLVETELLREYGTPADALDAYNQALKKHPGNSDLLYARGLHAANMGQLDLMEKDFLAVIAQNADNADALNALGYTLADQTTRYDDAMGYIKRALALKPDNAAILDSMGWIQYRLGNKAEAVKYLRKAVEAFPDAEIAGHLGEVLWSIGEREKAKKIWDEGLVLDPENKPLLDILKRHR